MNNGYLVFKDADGKETKEEVLRYIECNDFLYKGALGYVLLAKTEEHLYYICTIAEYENDLHCTENPYEVGRTRLLCYLINNHGKELRYVESFEYLMISNYILKKGIPCYCIWKEDLKRGLF